MSAKSFFPGSSSSSSSSSESKSGCASTRCPQDDLASKTDNRSTMDDLEMNNEEDI